MVFARANQQSPCDPSHTNIVDETSLCLLESVAALGRLCVAVVAHVAAKTPHATESGRVAREIRLESGAVVMKFDDDDADVRVQERERLPLVLAVTQSTTRCDASVMTGPYPQHEEGVKLVETLVQSRERAVKERSLVQTQLLTTREELDVARREISKLQRDLGQCKDIIMMGRLRLPAPPLQPSPVSIGNAAASQSQPITMSGVLEQGRQLLRPVVLMEVARSDVLAMIRASQRPQPTPTEASVAASTSANQAQAQQPSLSSSLADAQSAAMEVLMQAKAEWRARQESELLTSCNGVGDDSSSAGASRKSDMEAAVAIQKLQEEIINSLEREVAVLRRQRDENLRETQSQLSQMFAELEDAQSKMDESTAEWEAKNKELNRLRTLMRFSQLKRDSDKLHETYARVDELESRLRKYQQASYRETLDRQELRRLKMLEAHCRAAMSNAVEQKLSVTATGGDEAPSSLLKWLIHAIPTHLVGLQAGASPSAAAAVAPASPHPGAAKSVSSGKQQTPATPAPGTRRVDESASLPPPAPRETASVMDANSSGIVSDDGSEPCEVSPSPSSVVFPAAPQPMRDEDAPLSLITQRMREYLERKKMPEPPASVATQQQPQQSASSARPASASQQPRRRMTGATPVGALPWQHQATVPHRNPKEDLVTGSGLSSLKRPARPSTAGNARAAGAAGAAATGPMAPKSFAFIGGRMIPVYK